MQPLVSLDAEPYWEGLRSGRLLVQRCAICGAHRHYPRPMCPACHSFEVQWEPVAGDGTVHSWTVVHRSALAGFAEAVPFTLVTVDLPESVRMLGLLIDAGSGALRIGATVHAAVQAGPAGVFQPVFRLT